MKKRLKKTLVKLLAKFNITPYVYYTYKWNNPDIITQRLFDKNSEIVIFDVGAYDGRSLEKYKKMFPKSHVHSFEPTPNMFNHLTEKFGSNSTITLHNVALSSQVGEASFFINNSLLTNSLLQSAGNDYVASQQSYANQQEIKVKTETVDAVIEKQKLSKIDILKIDAQGADLQVLKGASDALRSRSIKLILVEVEFLQLYKEQPLFHDLSAFLHSFEYNLYSLYNISISKKGEMIYGDAIFLSPDIKI